MPYVLPERRPALDPIVDEMSKLANDRYNIGHLILLLMRNEGLLGVVWPECLKMRKLIEEANVRPNGDINYILFKFCKYNVQPSYNSYKNYMGIIYRLVEGCKNTEYADELRESAEWIRIKLLTPYEEEKCKINGDV